MGTCSQKIFNEFTQLTSKLLPDEGLISYFLFLFQVSGVKINDITYQDIYVSLATEIAMKLDCSKQYPCSDITLEDIKLTYNNEPAQSSCINADGKSSGLVQPNSCLYN